MAIPGVGTFVQYLTKGRKEIVAAIKVSPSAVRGLACSHGLLTNDLFRLSVWLSRSAPNSRKCCKAHCRKKSCATPSLRLGFTFVTRLAQGSYLSREQHLGYCCGCARKQELAGVPQCKYYAGHSVIFKNWVSLEVVFLAARSERSEI
jgi:hypothetical protein